MSKYPCGVCTIGVKHKGVFCKGSCNQWYHAECVNITSKDFKQLTKMNPVVWICRACSKSLSNNSQCTSKNNEDQVMSQSISKNNSQTLHVEHTPHYRPSSNTLSPYSLPQQEIRTINTSIHELERSLTENEPKNEEESLAIAAKIGSALLEENKILKEQNAKLSNTLNGMEAKIEELEKNEEIYLSRVESLQQKNTDLESQLVKQKEQLLGAEGIFEEHDRKQEQLLKEYESKIYTQEKEISSLKNRLPKEDDLIQEASNLKNAEAQTEQSNKITNSPSLLIEIGFLKKSYNMLEEKLKTLETEVNNLASKKIAGTPQYMTDTKTLNTLNKTSNRCPNRKPANKKTQNHYSISLQVNKFKTSELHTSETINSKCEYPPASAKLRGKNESIEDFFNKHLKEHKVVTLTTTRNQSESYNKGPPQKMLDTKITTENTSQTLTINTTTTGRTYQTPTQKQSSTTPSTTATGRICQTPTQKQSNTTTLTTGRICQTPTQKQSNTTASTTTGRICQTPTQKQTQPAKPDQHNNLIKLNDSLPVSPADHSTSHTTSGPSEIIIVQPELHRYADGTKAAPPANPKRQLCMGKEKPEVEDPNTIETLKSIEQKLLLKKSKCTESDRNTDRTSMIIRDSILSTKHKDELTGRGRRTLAQKLANSITGRVRQSPSTRQTQPHKRQNFASNTEDHYLDQNNFLWFSRKKISKWKTDPHPKHLTRVFINSAQKKL